MGRRGTVARKPEHIRGRKQCFAYLGVVIPRILILATDAYSPGGIARYTWTLASALRDLVGPDKVHVLALLNAGCPSGSPRSSKILGTIPEGPTATSKILFAAKALRQATSKYDLIICSHVALAPIAAAIRVLYGTHFWVVCHGIEVWGRLPLPEHWALKRADQIVSVSRFTSEMIADVNGIPKKQIRILHNAVSDEFAGLLGSQREMSVPLSLNARKKCLLSVGVLSKAFSYKGFDTVIRTLPKVREAVPSLHYTVVGDGDDKWRLQKLSNELGVEEHVEFKGQVSDFDLAALYRTCDVFVLPSKTRRIHGHWEGEGFGRVYIEAALAGKPVVGSREGGAAEAVLDKKTGFLVDPSSTSEIAVTLIALLRDPGLAAAMGRQGQRWARENFTASALRVELSQMLGPVETTRQEKEMACAGFLE